MSADTLAGLLGDSGDKNLHMQPHHSTQLRQSLLHNFIKFGNNQDGIDSLHQIATLPCRWRFDISELPSGFGASLDPPAARLCDSGSMAAVRALPGYLQPLTHHCSSARACSTTFAAWRLCVWR